MTQIESCIICTENIENNNIIILNCGHKYHTDCIIKLLSYQDKKCPLCRESIKFEVPENELQHRLNTNENQLKKLITDFSILSNEYTHIKNNFTSLQDKHEHLVKLFKLKELECELTKKLYDKNNSTLKNKNTLLKLDLENEKNKYFQLYRKHKLLEKNTNKFSNINKKNKEIKKLKNELRILNVDFKIVKSENINLIKKININEENNKIFLKELKNISFKIERKNRQLHKY